jgi:hypothetical protein
MGLLTILQCCELCPSTAKVKAMTEDPDFLQRRALVTGAAVLGAGLAAVTPAQAQGKGGPAAWRPAKEKLDDWLEIPGAHRFAFDCITPGGAGAVLGFARTYYQHNRDEYGLEPSSLAVVILLRAGATPFGYNDAMWAKYGRALSDPIKLVDPTTQAPPVRNIFNTKGSPGPGAGGVIQSELVERGAHFAVCGSATTNISEIVARSTGGQAGAIRAELSANLIPGARLVPAGIITLNRTQERGYAVAHIG